MAIITYVLGGLPLLVHWLRHWRKIERQLSEVADRVQAGEIVYGSQVQFRTMGMGSLMKDDDLVWKIAAGVVIGSLALGGLRFCQQQMAIRQFNQTMAKISADAAVESNHRQVEMARRNADRERSEAIERQAELEARTLLPGQRCIGKNLFARVDNGWVQVLDGSATLKCGR